MASFGAFPIIKYLALENIDQGAFVNTIASINQVASSKSGFR
jgi:hypothetical protein